MTGKVVRYLGILLVVASGCTVYRPLPIPAGMAADAPDMHEVHLKAGGVSHPLLPRLAFDDRDGLSPDEAAILAVVANPALRAVRDRRDIARAQLVQAGILPNPELAYEVGIPVGSDASGRGIGHGVGVSWDFRSLFSRSARMDAAKAHVGAVDLDIAWQEWQVAQAARLHAYRLAISGRRIAAGKEAVDILERLVKDAKRAVDMGIRTKVDLAAAQAGLRDVTSLALRAQSAREQERLALNRVLGLPSRKAIPLESKISWRVQPALSAEALFKHAETARLDLLALKLGYASQEARVRAAVRMQFPRINLGLTAAKDTDGVQTTGAGLSIDLPFFDRNQGRIAEARATRRQLFDDYAARLFEAQADIDRLVAALTTLRRRLAAAAESLSAAETLAAELKHAADRGEVGVFTYYKAIRTVYDQKIRRLELEQKMVELGIALEIASGRYGLVGTPGTANGTETSQ